MSNPDFSQVPWSIDKQRQKTSLYIDVATWLIKRASSSHTNEYYLTAQYEGKSKIKSKKVYREADKMMKHAQKLRDLHGSFDLSHLEPITETLKKLDADLEDLATKMVEESYNRL